ncbi:MAG: CBS domain-containing protein [Nevskiales bacterium]
MSNIGTVAVREYMTTKLVTFTPDMEVMSALAQLVQHGHSGAPVLDAAGRLIGMLSEKDCLKVAVMANFEGVSPGKVSDYMTTQVKSIGPDTSLLEIAGVFIDAPFKRLPVIENGKLLGQISRSDVLRAINDLS